MANLKLSTAYTRSFLMVSSTDHVTGLTGATVTVALSKAGGAFAAAGGTVSEIGNGWYKVALTTTDTGTAGDLAFHCTATGGDPTDFADQVTANVLGDTLPANVTQINSVSTSAVTTVDAVIGATGDPYAQLNTLIPHAFTYDANNLPKVDVVDIAGTASAGAAGYVGIDWAYVNAPTTAQNLSGTTISTSQAVASVSGSVGSVTGNVGGNVGGSVASVTAQVTANVTDWGGAAVTGMPLPISSYTAPPTPAQIAAGSLTDTDSLFVVREFANLFNVNL